MIGGCYLALTVILAGPARAVGGTNASVAGMGGHLRQRLSLPGRGAG
jgi:hypothetical protein